MIKNQGRKFRRECGVSEFQLIAEGVLAKEVYAANPKAFDNELDRHFKEIWQWLSKQPRTVKPARKDRVEKIEE